MGQSSTFRNLPEAKRERILDGALSEFANNGYARASLNRLVSYLGISKGSIFQYFSDKSGLFSAVFDFAVDRVKNHLRQVRESTRGQDVFSRIRTSLVSGMALIQANPRLFQLYLKVVFEGDVPFRGRLLSSIRLFSRDYLLDLLREGIEAGELRPDLELDAAAFVLDAVLERFLIAQSVSGLDAGLGLYQADPERAAKLADQLVDLLRKGLAS